MKPVFGIYVGNSNASVAVCKEDGKIEVISNELGERVTPAVVSIAVKEQLVGSVAKASMLSKSSSVITNNKLLLIKALYEEGKNKSKNPDVFIKDGVSHYKINLIGDADLINNAGKVNTLIYRKLLDIAKSAIHAKDKDTLNCVVVLPLGLEESDVQYILQSIVISGWNVLQTIREPNAPILAYNLLDSTNKSIPKTTENILVYRLGGVSSHATLLELLPGGMLSILESSYSNEGAYKLIDSFVSYLANEFYKKYKLDPQESPKSMVKLRQHAETCMHSLSNLCNTNIFIESLYEGVDFHLSVSRARIETILMNLMTTFMKPINEALKKTAMNESDIHKVILCGGPMKIPKLRACIKQQFKISEIIEGLPFDEIMAIGAAKQAWYLEKFSQINLKCTEITSDSKVLKIGTLLKIPVLKEVVVVVVTGYLEDEFEMELNSLIPQTVKIFLASSDKTQEVGKFNFEIFTKEKNTVLKKSLVKLETCLEFVKDFEYALCILFDEKKELEICAEIMDKNTQNIMVKRMNFKIII
uniref:Heat shock 70 kDa protein 14 n=2 Tax=Clastoptera arizonana TaxID=38151 RepID=A0A1B6E9P1_9HEMI